MVSTLVTSRQEGPNSQFFDNLKIPGVPGWRAFGEHYGACRWRAFGERLHLRQMLPKCSPPLLAKQQLPEIADCQNIGYGAYLLLVLYQYTLPPGFPFYGPNSQIAIFDLDKTKIAI